MSNTSDNDRALLDRQDLTLDPDGRLDSPEELETADSLTGEEECSVGKIGRDLLSVPKH